MNQISELYKNRLGKFNAEKSQLERRSRLYVFGKLVSFIAAVVLLYMAYPDFGWTYVVSAILCLTIYLYLLVIDKRCSDRIETLRRKADVCSNELKYLDGDFSPFRNGEQFINPDHEYSFDLDLFGAESLFHRINRTVTEKGEVRLAEKFSNIAQDKDEIIKNRDAIAELKTCPDWLISFMSEPFISDKDSFSGTKTDTAKRSWLQKLPYVSIFITVCSLILGIADIVPMTLFSALFILQLFAAMIFSKKMHHANLKASILQKKYEGYNSLLTKLQTQDFQSEKIKNIKWELFYSENNSQRAFTEISKILNLMDQRGNQIIYILFNGLFLFDFLLVQMFNKWESKYLSFMDAWINRIAEIDALVSLSVYAFNNPHNADASIIDNPQSETIIRATDVYHPFLSYKNAVANDFTLRRNNIAIVTGANMAGKSTFLRTVGVNYILACCGAPVCAKSFEFSIVSLFSSMRTSDNLAKDISYFNAELLRIKKLINHVKSHAYTFIILDEILKGTNSKDKLTGSIMFLEAISHYNISGIIATHDLELAKLEEKDSTLYTNYCFEIELSEEIRYTYKISKGVAQNMNASYLLSSIINSQLQ